MPLSRNDEREPRRLRYRRAAAVLVAGIALLFVGVGRLQLGQHQRFEDLAERNWVRLEILRAPRGRIFDARGTLLADNAPSFSVVFRPPPLGSALPDTLPLDARTLLAEVLALPDSVIRAATVQARGRGLPVALRRDVPFEIAAAVEERRADLPGIEVRLEPRRSYPESTAAAHFLGYAGEISGGELEEMKERGYRSGDLIGRAGLEAAYESELRGTDGREIVVVNATGRRVRLFEDQKPVLPTPGRDLILTVDARLQRALEQALDEHGSGAAVAVDPRTGGILAMASRPAFDPNEFARGLSSRRWRELVEDRAHPLLNRAIQSAYPPASTYKVWVSLVGLEEGAITPQTRFPTSCTGGYFYGGRYYRCWYSAGHGSMSLSAALAHSCDVYYYQLGLKLGVGALERWGKRLGLGEATGIDLPGERAGLLPGTEYYDRKRGQGRWTRGVLLNIAIGQGEMLLTPLQMAMMAVAVANRGRVPVPHLVRAVRDPLSGVETPVRHGRERRVQANEATWDAVLAAMEQVVTGGTGGRARVPGVRVGGKTGTAQNPHGEDHALFVAVAPLDDPQIVMAIMLENAGHGGSEAAPVAGRALNFHLRPEAEQRPGPAPPVRPDSTSLAVGDSAAAAEGD